MEFIPFGAADKIKLSVEIVKNFIAIPTRSGKTCGDRDALKFMMLCSAQRLNPFAGDAFLTGYDKKDGTVAFSLITAHVAFLKRAETCPDYEGMESGVILASDEGAVTEREGDFKLSTETCVGGWARVFRKGRKPTYRRLSIASMIPNYETPFWSEAKAPGQIVKCAEADALRATFPTLLGGLYSEGEILDIPQSRNVGGSAVLIEARTAEPEGTSEASATSESPKAPQRNAQEELASVVIEAGFTFEQFSNWLEQSGNNEASFKAFTDLPPDLCKRLLRGKAGLLSGLEMLKGGAV